MTYPSGPANGARLHALFVRHKTIKTMANFQNALEDEFVAALKLHCDVSVIDQDFDYGAVCDTINPDFVLIGSPGGNRAASVTITNTNARQDIPRIGFMDQDPHDTARVSFFRLLDEMKVERMFTFGAGAIRQSPELDGRAYTLSLFIDGGVFHDYGLEKTIPVSIFGGTIAPEFYHWRGANTVPMLQNFPTLLYTHPGYDPKIPPHRFPVSGAEYAKMLSRSHFSLADATRLDCVVRKHLEIPACGAVLVAPQSVAMERYGFKDMHNCIMDTGVPLCRKIASVADNPELYRSIQKNGHDLVHSRYTRDKWRGILDWYACVKSLRPGEEVQQQGELGPFIAIPAGSAAMTGGYPDSDFTTMMKSALQKILDGQDLDGADALLKAIVQWVHIGEPWILLGLSALLRGQTAQAKDFFVAPLTTRTRREGSSCLDPEEMAWLMITGALLNDTALTNGIRDAAKNIHHLGLRRAEWLLKSLATGLPPPLSPDLEKRQPGDRISSHWTGQLDLPVWLGLMERILAANGKKDFGASTSAANLRSGTI